MPLLIALRDQRMRAFENGQLSEINLRWVFAGLGRSSIGGNGSAAWMDTGKARSSVARVKAIRFMVYWPFRRPLYYFFICR